MWNVGSPCVTFCPLIQSQKVDGIHHTHHASAALATSTSEYTATIMVYSSFLAFYCTTTRIKCQLCVTAVNCVRRYVRLAIKQLLTLARFLIGVLNSELSSESSHCFLTNILRTIMWQICLKSRPLSRRRSPNLLPKICPPKIRRKNRLSQFVCLVSRICGFQSYFQPNFVVSAKTRRIRISAEE